MAEGNEGVAGKSRPSPFRNPRIFEDEPIDLPFHLVAERELGYLTNDVLAEYPIASDAILAVALREHILEFELLAQRAWVEEEIFDDPSGHPYGDGYDYEGPNHPCNYCYVSRRLCATCERFECSKAMQEVIAEGGDPVKAFPDLTEEERRSLG